jgi:hypothetical protein
MIEMIKSKLDKQNNQEEEMMDEIERLWEDLELEVSSFIIRLNEIISKLNKKEPIIEYYDGWNVEEYI